MARWRRVTAVLAAVAGIAVLHAAPADAAGIVTHAWMAMDAVEQVDDVQLRDLLRAHLDQVRAGAEFPDGGYITRSLGTPGGDYGEEAHWQRFVDAYAAQIRDDPDCGDLTDPAGPCAPVIAHLMGVAGHGMGDQVWDWLFEPNGPGFGESYLPPDFQPFVGPGGLELQLDIVAIQRYGRPTGATVDPPDAAKLDDAFAAAGRADILPSAFTIGEQGLELERTAEAFWAPMHVDALERAMPWTSAHLITAAGGVDFGARAIAGYYDAIWARLLGRSVPTRVTATAPFAGQRNVPATGWTGSYSPGSNPGNSSGLTRIAAALSSSLPYRPLAGQGSLPDELPAGSMQLRDLTTGTLVPPRAGYPRIVPYNPEAGEHMVAFQPAGDLQPCRWYRVETTDALVDFRGAPVEHARWRFRTSGCEDTRPVRGTTVCDANGGFVFAPGLSSSLGGTGTQGGALLALSGCDGGQDGAAPGGAALPVASGLLGLHVRLPGASCRHLTSPTEPATVHGEVQWYDAAGRAVGTSRVDPQSLDLRGDVLRITGPGSVFRGHDLALRITPDATSCGTDAARTVAPVAAGTVTVWRD
jgi:hypothetical protein